MKTDIKVEKFYTPKQVARLLRVENLTVLRWLRSGDFKGVRVGKLWRISHSQLEEFLALELETIGEER